MVNLERTYQVNEKEELAIQFVDAIHVLRNLMKLRKKERNILVTVANHLAEMLEGTGKPGDTDLDLLEMLATTAQKLLADKINNKETEDEEEFEVKETYVETSVKKEVTKVTVVEVSGQGEGSQATQELPPT